MKRTLWGIGLCFLAGAGLMATAVLLLMRAHAEARPPAQQASPPSPSANTLNVAVAPRADLTPYLSKYVIENPTEQLLAAKKGPAAAPPAPAFDRPKSKIEGGTQRLLANQTSVQKLPAAPQPFANPKVEPGKVRWHRTFVDACAAAQKSGKPVLLFQMMGNLDDRFC